MFNVILKPETTQKQLEELVEKNSVEMIGVSKLISCQYYLACTTKSKGNSLEMANLFYESGLFCEASPGYYFTIDILD